MNKLFSLFLMGIILPVVVTAAESDHVKLEITRLDCGTIQFNNLNLFSDIDAYIGQKKTLVVGCYLLRHGDEYMLWDAGLPASLKGAELSGSEPMSSTVGKTIVEQLNELGVEKTKISIIAISHYHFDHVGQLPDFPHAKILIGGLDWEAVTSPDPGPFISAEPFKSWIDSGAENVEQVYGDKDIFGDGKVIMLATPGHTPGHSSLLVRLANKGAILITGDLAHFTANYKNDGVPIFNTDRADTLASLQRFKGLARNNRAMVIIQHEAADIAKLPAFPGFAD